MPKGLEHARQFSWEKAARDALRAKIRRFSEVVNGFYNAYFFQEVVMISIVIPAFNEEKLLPVVLSP